jgi:hypothetical protein
MSPQKKYAKIGILVWRQCGDNEEKRGMAKERGLGGRLHFKNRTWKDIVVGAVELSSTALAPDSPLLALID